VHLPYWLLGYEAMISIFVDRSDQNAPNQSMLMSRAIVNAKRSYLSAGNHADVLANFTIDSPIPFDLDAVISELEGLNTEMVEGAKTQKQGDYFGKLSRLIQRLQNKRTDRRLGFLFQCGADSMKFEWLEKLVSTLVAGTKDQTDGLGGVKIVDFSEVPSDILPLMISLVAKLAFSVQQWTPTAQRHPIAYLWIFAVAFHHYDTLYRALAGFEIPANIKSQGLGFLGRSLIIVLAALGFVFSLETTLWLGGIIFSALFVGYASKLWLQEVK
jgi:hypothetical protein